MPCTDSCKAIGPVVMGRYVLRTEGYKAIAVIGPVVIGRFVLRTEGYKSIGPVVIGRYVRKTDSGETKQP